MQNHSFLSSKVLNGMNKASDTSIQSHEDTVYQLAPMDRGRFQTNGHRRQAIKEQIIRLKTKKIEDDFLGTRIFLS